MFFSVLWVEILNGRHRGTRSHTGWLSYNSYPTPPTIEKIVVGVGVWLKNLEDIKFIVVVWNICLIKGGAINFSLSFQNVKLIFIVWKMIIDWDFSFHYDLFHVLLLLLYFNLWSLRFLSFRRFAPFSLALSFWSIFFFFHILCILLLVFLIFFILTPLLCFRVFDFYFSYLLVSLFIFIFLLLWDWFWNWFGCCFRLFFFLDFFGGNLIPFLLLPSSVNLL